MVTQRWLKVEHHSDPGQCVSAGDILVYNIMDGNPGDSEVK